MRRYDLQNEWQKLLVPDIVALLAQIHECKGEQKLLLAAGGGALAQLAETAKIQSAGASNQIEGIDASDERLKMIVLDKTTPRTRHEQDIAGYRDVLAAIHGSYAYIPLRPAMILQLHRDLYKFSGTSTGGNYKSSVTAEAGGAGSLSLCCRPVPAQETPEAVDLACRAYDEAVRRGADPLLIIPMFTLDFLCIRPFSAGNGRMSRLLTLLLLCRNGYAAGKYISMERVMEQSREAYREALRQSSAGWNENGNDYAPFVRYMLGVTAAVCREFSSRAQALTAKSPPKPDRIRQLLKGASGRITKTEILERCPDISQVTVQRTLIELQKKGEIIKLGGGRYTAYTWNKETE